MLTKVTRAGLTGLSVWTVVSFGFPESGLAKSGEICPVNLPARINRVISQSGFERARWGVLVQTLSRSSNRRQTLFERDSQKYFLPASNAKLLTTAAALQQLGSRYRIRTSIFGQRTSTGAWNLRVVGHGDPSLKDKQLQQLVAQLKQRGVKQIARLVLDNRYFGDDLVNPSWDWGDLQSGYGSIANSLMVNLNYHSLTLTPQQLGQTLRLRWNEPQAIAGFRIDNQTRTVGRNEPEFIRVSRALGQPTLKIRGQLRVGAKPDVVDLATLNPVSVFGSRLKLALAAAKIPVAQVQVAEDKAPNFQQELAFVESPPLADLVRETNAESDNLYAESLLQTIGVTAPRPKSFKITAEDNATAAGIKVLQKTLTQIGVDATGYRLFDGSGLSRMNLVSPSALVQILQAMYYQPSGPKYRASLPIAGRTGTLKYRFRNTAAAEITQAKTGTLTGALSLSGYISPKGYQPIAFSILLNQGTQPNSTQRRAIDAIVLLLAQLKRC